MVFTERIVGGIPHFITGRLKELRKRDILFIYSFSFLFFSFLGAGGFLQNIVFGYAGLQIENTNITIYPSILPPGTTTKITIRKVLSSSLFFFLRTNLFIIISFNTWVI